MSAEFVIRNAKVFDGERVYERLDVAVREGRIAQVGTDLATPADGDELDAAGQALLPGLIDGHAHAQPPALAHALRFGVTTVLDMFSMPDWMDAQRLEAAERNDLADVRSASVGATVLGGLPSMLIGSFFPTPFPVLATVDDAPAFVEARVNEGADYIKLLIDDGTALGHTGPSLTEEMAKAVVEAAHVHGKMAVAHATSLDGVAQAIRAGVDGLVHIFFDRAPTDEIVRLAKEADVFVTPTLSTVGSLASDIDGSHLAHDPRAEELIPAEWKQNLCQCWHLGSPGSVDHALAATKALHDAGVEILAGTDATCVGVAGTAHGISMHGELELLVRAGLTPIEALRAATSATARRFNLGDRGRIAVGLQADLLLVDGDPTTQITDTLSISRVWRRGVQLDRTPAQLTEAARV
nr:aryldialkylphosphatase (EC 3.1.8.1) - Nocardia sp. (strain B-1) [Nocardia sp.]AAA25371.1 organophosphate acid anhydrase [Mycobacterium sp.]